MLLTVVVVLSVAGGGEDLVDRELQRRFFCQEDWPRIVGPDAADCGSGPVGGLWTGIISAGEHGWQQHFPSASSSLPTSPTSPTSCSPVASIWSIQMAGYSVLGQISAMHLFLE